MRASSLPTRGSYGTQVIPVDPDVVPCAWALALTLLLLPHMPCRHVSIVVRKGFPASFLCGGFGALDASVARLLLGWGSEATESPLTQSGDGSPESAAAGALH